MWGYLPFDMISRPFFQLLFLIPFAFLSDTNDHESLSYWIFSTSRAECFTCWKYWGFLGLQVCFILHRWGLLFWIFWRCYEIFSFDLVFKGTDSCIYPLWWDWRNGSGCRTCLEILVLVWDFSFFNWVTSWYCSENLKWYF